MAKSAFGEEGRVQGGELPGRSLVGGSCDRSETPATIKEKNEGKVEPREAAKYRACGGAGNHQGEIDYRIGREPNRKINAWFA